MQKIEQLVVSKEKQKYYNNITETIGNTPIIKLNRISKGLKPTVLVKAEFFNPLGSVKDRIGLSMIKDAEEKGLINSESHIVEPTSGNTGIGLAMVSAAKGYPLTLTMPDSMSLERRKILKAFGAKLVLTPASEGMKGAILKANELAQNDPNIYIPQQFNNPANPQIHRETTAREILDVLGTNLDAFVSGIGTGGTITGAGEVLRKEIGSKLKIFAVEPIDSPVLSGGKPGPHKIQGIGAGFIPTVLNTKVYDEIVMVSIDDAIKTTRALAKLEGLFVGISAGAATWAALKVAERYEKDQNVLTILPDIGERYLSTGVWDI
ncbi:MAG: cysteine synthase A [Candidatus Hodarchaeales archaeon]|jgi:cysteine synthase A